MNCREETDPERQRRAARKITLEARRQQQREKKEPQTRQNDARSPRGEPLEAAKGTDRTGAERLDRTVD